jgi:hypothetical protein
LPLLGQFSRDFWLLPASVCAGPEAMLLQSSLVLNRNYILFPSFTFSRK